MKNIIISVMRMGVLEKVVAGPDLESGGMGAIRLRKQISN